MSARRREEALNVNVARLIVPFEGVAEGGGGLVGAGSNRDARAA